MAQKQQTTTTTNATKKTTKEYKKLAKEYNFVSPAAGTDEVRSKMNDLLSNEYGLFTKTLNYHWNVTGPRFHSVHAFLEEQYRELLEIIDATAERVREIGGTPIGTLKEMRECMSVEERPGVLPDTTGMIMDLMHDHEKMQVHIKSLLTIIDRGDPDPGSEDFLSGLIKKHEEMAWMLKSHIEN